MKAVGVVGLGNMGAGLARNLMSAGFDVRGWDILGDKVEAHKAAGGIGCGSPAEVGDGAEAVFIMVMNGDQVKEVIFGDQGLATTLAKGSVILISATIHAHEAVEIAKDLDGSGYHLIDTPVSGGRPGADGGTLTLMAAGSDAAFKAAQSTRSARTSGKARRSKPVCNR